jgi:hypothetical protein
LRSQIEGLKEQVDALQQRLKLAAEQEQAAIKARYTRDYDELARAQERVIETLQGFTIGGRVFHQKFGYGRITGVDGQRLAINFDAAGDKKIMANFVRACVETEQDSRVPDLGTFKPGAVTSSATFQKPGYAAWHCSGPAGPLETEQRFHAPVTWKDRHESGANLTLDRSPPGDDGGATHLPSAMFLSEIGTTLGVGQHPDSRASTLKQ